MKPTNTIAVKTKDLVCALNAASRTVLSQSVCHNTNLPFTFSAIVFQVKSSFMMNVMASNYRMHTTTRVQITDGKGPCRRFAIMAEDFLPVVRRLEGEELTIEVFEYQAIFRHTYGSFTVPLVTEDLDFLFERMDRLETRCSDHFLSLENPFLHSMLKRLCKYTAQDDLRPAMKGICIRREKGSIHYVASDGHRLMRITKTDESDAEDSTLLISDDVIKILRRIVPNMGFTKIDWHESKNEEDPKDKAVCHVFTGDTDFWFEPTYGKFPDFSKVIPGILPCSMRIRRTMLSRSLDRMSYFCTVHKIISAKVDKDKITLFGKDKDFNVESTETLPCEYSGKPFSFGLGIDNMQQILSSMICREVVIQSKGDPYSPLVVFPGKQSDRETVTILFMPCSVSED